MFRVLFSLCFIIWVGIGVASYWVAAGTQADWSQLVTYIWVFFWPFVILLTLIYYSPFAFLAVAAAIFFGWFVVRRCAQRRPRSGLS